MEYHLSSWSTQIKFCRHFRHPARWHLNRIWPDYALYYLMEGSLQLTLPQGSFQAEAGDVIFFLPGFHGELRAVTECHFFLACFRVDFGNYHHLFYHRNSAGIFRRPLLEEPARQLYQAFSLPGQGSGTYSPRQYAALTTFLAELMAADGQQQAFQATAPDYDQWRLHQLIQFMQAQAPKVIPIAQLAQQMQMSQKYFIQYFRERVGCTPGQYMTRERMRHAGDLLAKTDLTLEQIAHALHYADAYAFSKAFRNFYGEPPGAFRNHAK